MIKAHLSKVLRAKEWALWPREVVVISETCTGGSPEWRERNEYWTFVCTAKGQHFNDIWDRTNLQGRKIIKRKVLLFLCLCVAPRYLEIVVSSLVWEALCPQLALDTKIKSFVYFTFNKWTDWWTVSLLIWAWTTLNPSNGSTSQLSI